MSEVSKERSKQVAKGILDILEQQSKEYADAPRVEALGKKLRQELDHEWARIRVGLRIVHASGEGLDTLLFNAFFLGAISGYEQKEKELNEEKKQSGADSANGNG